MTYSEYIKSILQTIAKHTSSGTLSMPDVLTAQLVGQTQVHPSAIGQFSNAIQMATSEQQLDGLIIDYFKLLQTQVENLDFKVAENMTGIFDAVPLLNNGGMHNMSRAYKYSFAAKVRALLDFLIGTDDVVDGMTMRKIKEGVLDRYADELKNVGIAGNAEIPAGGSGFSRRSTIASMGKNIPDNLLLFMIDMPNRVYKAYDIMGETDVEIVNRILESIKEYKVEEFIDDKFLQEIIEIVDGPNLQDATDFLVNNNFDKYVTGAANIKAYDLHKDIISAMSYPLVELTRVYAAESVTYRNSVQYMRLLADNDYLLADIIDGINVSSPRSTFINLLAERDIKFNSTKEFVQDLTKRLRKGAEMYNKFDFEELIANPNMVNELKNDLSKLMYTYQEWHDVITTRGGNNLPSPVRDALMKTKYSKVFGDSQAGNYFQSISQFFGDPMSNNINDVSNAVEELGLFDTITLDFIKEASELPQGNNNFINFMDPAVLNQPNPIAKALNIVKNKNVPVENGFDIFSFKPPANEIFHVGPSQRLLDEIYKIKDIGNIELWNWAEGKFVELAGNTLSDVWQIAEQIIGDVKNAPDILAEEVLGKGIELPDRVIIKLNKPGAAKSQALLGINHRIAVPTHVNAGDRIAEVVKNMDADKIEDVVNVIKQPKIGKAITSTAIDFAKKAGKVTGGTALTAFAPGDVAIELGIKRLLPKLGLAAISTPALAAYTAYELALLAADVGKGLASAKNTDDGDSFGRNFWEGFQEAGYSDNYSIGYKLTKEIHNTLFEDVYGRIAQDLYAGTDS